MPQDVWDMHSECSGGTTQEIPGSFLCLPAVTICISHIQGQRQPGTAAPLWTQCIGGTVSVVSTSVRQGFAIPGLLLLSHSDNPDPTKGSGHGTAVLPAEGLGHAQFPAGNRELEGTQGASLLGNPLRPQS